MIKLSDGGAYLINGVDIVEDSASAVNEVAAKTGCSVTTLRGVYLRHRLADTRRCARNDDYLICQCLHIFFIHVLHLRPPFSRRNAASTSPAPPPP